ncbi:MAG TPA: RagB/SusD family nutrient uptake outer membrane protein, partial [Flavisolibacter sp.]|nr:RagB/SusD family nutrient uptake outer membrane protein [Flavisolibacter sp.]
MKKIIYSFLALALLSTTACKKDFLNQKPLDKYSDEAVWKDPSLVQTFVNNIYLGIPHGFSNIMMSAIVDETTYNADFGSSNVTLSRVTPSDYSIFDEGYWTGNRQRGMNWSIVYKFIRSANLFFEKVDGVQFTDAVQKDRLKGEVHFLRAYLYYNLVSMYGGVPLIDKTYSLTDEFSITRSSFEDCIKFITADLDKAAGFLPLSFSGSGALGSSNIGRATKGAALALKSRVLLYAA